MADLSDAEVVAASLVDPARFGDLFDRHATVLHRYLIRRVGADDADGLVGELFLIAFERRASFDTTASSARPWLYGIATNLVARRHRAEARRLRATARLAGRTPRAAEPADAGIESLDATERWRHVAEALTAIPAPERDALLLHAWEGLGYDEVAAALDIPVGTVRSRLNRARGRLRETRDDDRRTICEDHLVSDEFELVRRFRPDGIEPADPGDPAVYAKEKERLMATIQGTQPATTLETPDLYPRLAYEDEYAAIDYLTRVFGFVEHREARLEHGEHCLAWLRIGSGTVMLGHTNVEVHRITSPLTVGSTTVIMHVYVRDIDAHYAHAVGEGADVTMSLRDAFYGDRVYEATDLEGHRWHFGERFADIRARAGRVPEPEEPPG